MLNPIQIEEAYKEFIRDLSKCAHDGILQINLHFLHEQGLLGSLQDDYEEPEDLSQYFHVSKALKK